jgi:hypothetical protein
MKKREIPTPEQQLKEIAEEARSWGKVLPHLSPPHRARIETRNRHGLGGVAAAGVAQQRHATRDPQSHCGGCQQLRRMGSDIGRARVGRRSALCEQRTHADQDGPERRRRAQRLCSEERRLEARDEVRARLATVAAQEEGRAAGEGKGEEAQSGNGRLRSTTGWRRSYSAGSGSPLRRTRSEWPSSATGRSGANRTMAVWRLFADSGVRV